MRVWDAARLTPITGILLHESWVCTAEFDHKGTRIITACGDHVRVWDIATGRLLLDFRHPGISELHRHPQAWGIGAVFTPDDSRIVTGRQDDGYWGEVEPLPGDYVVSIWDATTGNHLADLKHAGPVRYFTVSPAGQVLSLAMSRTESAYHLWELPDGHEVAQFINDDDPAAPSTAPMTAPDQPAASFSADGTRLALANTYGFELRDLKSGKRVIRKFIYGEREDLHGQQVTGVVISPDGRKIAVLASSFGNIWDPAGKPLTPRDGITAVERIVFSPDSRYAMFNGVDEICGLWDLSTGARSPWLSPDAASDADAFSFDRQGARIAIGFNHHNSDYGGDTDVWKLPGRK